MAQMAQIRKNEQWSAARTGRSITFHRFRVGPLPDNTRPHSRLYLRKTRGRSRNGKLAELNPDLRRIWSPFNSLVLEIRTSHHNVFTLWLDTAHGRRRIMLHRSVKMSGCARPFRSPTSRAGTNWVPTLPRRTIVAPHRSWMSLLGPIRRFDSGRGHSASRWNIPSPNQRWSCAPFILNEGRSLARIFWRRTGAG